MEEASARITIIGTSHISTDSAREIERVIKEQNPDIIAVELDKRRLQALLTRKPGEAQQLPLSLARQVGVTGYLFLRIGAWAQKKLGGIVDVQPGVDMLAAVECAKAAQKPLALIDQDILITMKRFSAAFTFREKLRLIKDLLNPFGQKLRMSLSKVPDAQLIRTLLAMMRERYPSLYTALVHERNVYMAKRLRAIANANPGKHILAVVGAGHEEELNHLLLRSAA